MRKILWLLVVAVAVFSMSCSKNASNEKKISILLVSRSSQSVLADKLSKALEAIGCEPVVEFADEAKVTQDALVDIAAKSKVAAIFLSPIRDEQVAQSVKSAVAAKIPVIGVDGKVRAGWTGCISFDKTLVGRAMGLAVEDLMKASNSGNHTIEILAGDSSDEGARKIHEGMLEILSSYLNMTSLVSRSTRTSFEDCSVWHGEMFTARDFLRNYISNFYKAQKLSFVCAASDALARGAAEAIDGFPQEEKPCLISTGNSEWALEMVKTGNLAALVYDDPQKIANRCADIMQKKLNKKIIEEIDFVCEPTVVTSENISDFLTY